jgi:hypothetical protein
MNDDKKKNKNRIRKTMQHIPYMIFAAIPAFCAGFCAGGYIYRRIDVARRWRRSRRVPAREIVDAMKAEGAGK